MRTGRWTEVAGSEDGRRSGAFDGVNVVLTADGHATKRLHGRRTCPAAGGSPAANYRTQQMTGGTRLLPHYAWRHCAAGGAPNAARTHTAPAATASAARANFLYCDRIAASEL